tara:strand:+ start:1236 stop:1364 length:129 start_codon:yes stop_codon:yes gene_type:complete
MHFPGAEKVIGIGQPDISPAVICEIEVVLTQRVLYPGGNSYQ